MCAALYTVRLCPSHYAIYLENTASESLMLYLLRTNNVSTLDVHQSLISYQLRCQCQSYILLK